MRFRHLCIPFLIALTFLSACTSTLAPPPPAPAPVSTPTTTASTNATLAFTYHRDYGGRHTHDGLIAAAWSDGLLIFAADPSKSGEDLRLIHLTPAELAGISQKLADSGLFENPTNFGFVPDHTERWITLYDGNEVKRKHWDEMRGTFPTSTPSQSTRDFIAKWQLARAAILAACHQGAGLSSDPVAAERYELARAKGTFRAR